MAALPSQWRLWLTPFVEEPAANASVTKTRRISGHSIYLLALCLAGFGVQVALAASGSLEFTANAALWAIAALVLVLARLQAIPRLSLFLVSIILGVEIGNLVFETIWRTLIEERFGFYTGHALLAASLLVPLVAFGVVLQVPLRPTNLPTDDIAEPKSPPTHDLRSPEDNITWFQWMTVSWLSPLLHVGSSRQLNDDDVWKLPYEFQHGPIFKSFSVLRGSVIRRLLIANWIDLGILSLLTLLTVTANYAGPKLLQLLLQAFEMREGMPWNAITWSLLILVARVVAAQSSLFSLWFSRRCYERSRGEMMMMLSEKVLNISLVGESQAIDTDSIMDEEASNSIVDPDVDDTFLLPKIEDAASWATLHRRMYRGMARLVERLPLLWRRSTKPQESAASDMGKILSVLRADIYNIAERFLQFQAMLEKILGIFITFGLLWNLVGWSASLGVAMVVVTQALVLGLRRVLIWIETRRRLKTDARLRHVSQLIECIRHLRWYSLHPRWMQNAMTAREEELSMRLRALLLRLLITLVNFAGSVLLPISVFFAYTALAGQELTIDVAFPTVQLLLMLQQNLMTLPALIFVFANSKVGLKRMQNFMDQPEKVDVSRANVEGHTMRLHNASFAWPGLRSSVLTHIDVAFPSGLTVIVGAVGSGKSALLQSLLGELNLIRGSLDVPSCAIGYCAQRPWLQSMSIRDNILFGSPFDKTRYDSIISACALAEDFAHFENGDLSPIGENGVGLSGGQRTRVALARALYTTAPILLLDDPLSSLDQQTAELIVSRCFKTGLLQGRTVLIVTHRLDLLEGLAQQVLRVGNDGTVEQVQDTALMLSGEESSKQDMSRRDDAPEAAADVDDEAARTKFSSDEFRAHGNVKFAVYWQYIKAGGIPYWGLILLASVVVQTLMMASNWYLKEWAEAYGRPVELVLTRPQQTVLDVPTGAEGPSHFWNTFFERFPQPTQNLRPWLIGYVVLACATILANFTSECMKVLVTVTAGRSIFARALERVSLAPFRFYDVTPVGRLMNRMTGDMMTIDEGLAELMVSILFQMASWAVSAVMIASVAPTFLVFALLLTATFVSIFRRFLPSSQSLRRLEMASLSPLLSNFGVLIQGLVTIRAFRAEERFQNSIINTVDTFQKHDHFFWSCQGWMLYRFDVVAGVSTFILALIAIFTDLDAGLAAFVLVAAATFVTATHEMCKAYGQLELNFTSVERAVELLKLDIEPPGQHQPPAKWPSRDGEIEFWNVELRYAPDLDPAVSDATVRIQGGKHTAIIGRSGSGKTTLAMALLGTPLPSAGRIFIDGIDVMSVNKEALRSRVTYLAQDPVLFAGSIRRNLDPTDEYTEEECAAVLQQVLGRFDLTLDSPIEAGGSNLSQGQRQLLGFARALLRGSSIIIMDEATASIDLETSMDIQRLIKTKLKGSTIVSIAHRKEAVMHADWCIVMAKGKILEQGVPSDLLAREDTAKIEE